MAEKNISSQPACILPGLNIWSGTAFFLLVVYSAAKAWNGGDFDVYLHAAAKLSRLENIYQPPFLYKLPYIYSHFFALVLIPFTWLPRVVTEFGWLLANLFFLYRIWKLTSYYLHLKLLLPWQYRMVLVVTFALTLRFMLYNFDMIQLTIFLLYVSMESLYLIGKNRKTAGAVLLGVAMNIKILPLVLLPYLFYRREWRAGLVSIAVFAVLLFVPALFVGYDFNLTLLADWWTAINPASAARTAGEVEAGPHGLPALIPVLFMETTGNLPYRRHLLDLPYEQVFIVLNVTRLLLILLVLYFLRTLPFKPSPSRTQTFYELSYLFLVTPLLAPQQQKYAFFYVFPAVAYLVCFLISCRTGRLINFGIGRCRVVIVLLGVFFILTTGTWDILIGRPLSDITQHYRLITYGALLLIVPLALCKPQYLIQPAGSPWQEPQPELLPQEGRSK